MYHGEKEHVTIRAANRFLEAGSGGGREAVAFFALASIVQAFGNLLPVESFDGGRMLYCAISEIMDEKVAWRAVEIASALSAFIMWTLALFLMLKVSSGLGIYVFAVCIFLCTFKNS